MLLSGKVNNAEKFINSRRTNEEKISKLQSKLKQEFHEKQFAKWENKSTDVTYKKLVKERLNQIKMESERNLDERRSKLAAILKREHDEYSKETPEQMRERMINRVKLLKEQREQNRVKFVEEQMERKFKENADELRKVDADFKELKTVYERNLQMMEKQKYMEEQFEEEMIYAELYKRDIKKKEIEEKRKEEIRKRNVDERNQILDLQKNREWKNDQERQRALMELQFHTNRELSKKLQEFNEDQKARKSLIKKIEKDEDKRMIGDIIDRERQLDELELELKRKQKEDTRNFLLNYKNRTNELNTYEAELEKLVQQEDEKQWKKRMEIWQKEEVIFNVYL